MRKDEMTINPELITRAQEAAKTALGRGETEAFIGEAFPGFSVVISESEPVGAMATVDMPVDLSTELGQREVFIVSVEK